MAKDKGNWITLHRKLMKWEWYTDSQMLHLFIHLLLSANHEDGSWRGNLIKRGQLITGRKALSANTGISEQSIRTCLERLKSTNEITIKSTSKFSLVTLLKYSNYQDKENNQPSNQPAHQPTTNQPSNQQLTTNNKNKQINKLLSATADLKDLPKKLIEDKQRHIHIIGIYWKAKDFTFETKEAYHASLKRDLRAGRVLVGYKDEDIIGVMKYLIKTADYNWKLETVHKKIDEYVAEKK